MRSEKRFEKQKWSENVGIGTIETGTHKLAVDGTIGAREIKVEATGWSDFVFNKNYELKNLEEVENFIEENNHLPDIPSEKEVLENGIQLGEMDAKLLQKIEELIKVMEKNNLVELELKHGEDRILLKRFQSHQPVVVRHSERGTHGLFGQE